MCECGLEEKINKKLENLTYHHELNKDGFSLFLMCLLEGLLE